MTSPTLIFDLDGTLVDSAPDLIAAMNHTLTTEDIPTVDYTIARSWAGLGARGSVLKAASYHGLDANKLPLDAMFDTFLKHYLANISRLSQPFEGVIEALTQMRDMGWALGICTNKYQRYAEALLSDLALDGFFEVIIGADSTPWRKPDARHLTETINIMLQSADSTIFIGDSETDVATAKAANIPVIAVDFGYSLVSPDQLGADILVDHFDKIIPAANALLDQWQNSGV